MLRQWRGSLHASVVIVVKPVENSVSFVYSQLHWFHLFFFGCRIGEGLPLHGPFWFWRQNGFCSELRSRHRETCRHASTHAGSQWHNMGFCASAQTSSAGKFRSKSIQEEELATLTCSLWGGKKRMTSPCLEVWMISEPEHCGSWPSLLFFPLSGTTHLMKSLCSVVLLDNRWVMTPWAK